MVRDESSARLKRIVLSFDPMTQVSLPLSSSTTQVKVTFSPAHADLPAKLDVMISGAERDRPGIVHEYRDSNS